MSKINFSKINWSAKKNWEFWGCQENLEEAYKRSPCNRPSTYVSFGYDSPDPTIVYAPGDVVVFRDSESPHNGKFAVVILRSSTPYLHIRFADGAECGLEGSEIHAKLSPAEVPAELIALARAEAGSPVDLSKCPLKRPCCTEA